MTQQVPAMTWDLRMSARMKELRKPNSKLAKATLETTDLDFLEEAMKESFRVAWKGLRKEPMNDAQKQQKSRFLKRLRAGFQNLDLLWEPFRVVVNNRPAGWFDTDDIRKILPPHDLAWLVDSAISFGGKDYRSTIRNAVLESYKKEGWVVNFTRAEPPD